MNFRDQWAISGSYGFFFEFSSECHKKCLFIFQFNPMAITLHFTSDVANNYCADFSTVFFTSFTIIILIRFNLFTEWTNLKAIIKTNVESFHLNPGWKILVIINTHSYSAALPNGHSMHVSIWFGFCGFKAKCAFDIHFGNYSQV